MWLYMCLYDGLLPKYLPTRFEVLSQPIISDGSILMTSSRALMHILLAQLKIVDALSSEVITSQDKVARGDFYSAVNKLPRSLRYMIARRMLLMYREVLGGLYDVIENAASKELDWRERVGEYIDNLGDFDALLLARIMSIDEADPSAAREGVKEKITKYEDVGKLKSNIIRYITGSRSLDKDKVFDRIEEFLGMVYRGEDVGVIKAEKRGRLCAMLAGIIDIGYVYLSGVSKIMLPSDAIHSIISQILRSTIAAPEFNKNSLELHLISIYAASQTGQNYLAAYFLSVLIDAYIYYEKKYEDKTVSVEDTISIIIDDPSQIDIWIDKFSEKVEGEEVSPTLKYRVDELRTLKNLLKNMDRETTKNILKEMRNLAEAGAKLRRGIDIENNKNTINQILGPETPNKIEVGNNGELYLRRTHNDVFMLTQVLRVLELNIEMVRKAHGIPIQMEVQRRITEKGVTPVFASVYEMAMASKGGLSDPKNIRTLGRLIEIWSEKGKAAVEDSLFKRDFNDLLERVLDNLGFDRKSVYGRIFESALLALIMEGARREKAKKDSGKEFIRRKVGVLDTLINEFVGEDLIMQLVNPTSMEEFEEAKQRLAGMMLGVKIGEGENLIEKMVTEWRHTQLEETTTQPQQGSTEKNGGKPQQQTLDAFIGKIYGASRKTQIRQLFGSMFRKIFSKAAVKGFVKELAMQLWNGILVGIFTMLGMKIAEKLVEATTDKEKSLAVLFLNEKAEIIEKLLVGEKNMEDMSEKISSLMAREDVAMIVPTPNSPLSLMQYWQTKTILWLIITFLIGLFFKYIVTEKIVGNGKKVAVVTASALGIWAYAKDHGVGLMDNAIFAVSMMAWLWVWDEFDDFQDGIDSITGEEEEIVPLSPDEQSVMEEESGGVLKQLFGMELTVGSMLLGFFGHLLGVSDPMQLIIPGRLGFAQYVCEVLPPSPWDVVLRCVYEILSFVLANVIASGARGVGWVFYLAGSVVGNLVVGRVLEGLSA